jgi:hypothetical protein
VWIAVDIPRPTDLEEAIPRAHQASTTPSRSSNLNFSKKSSQTSSMTMGSSSDTQINNQVLRAREGTNPEHIQSGSSQTAPLSSAKEAKRREASTGSGNLQDLVSGNITFDIESMTQKATSIPEVLPPKLTHRELPINASHLGHEGGKLDASTIGDETTPAERVQPVCCYFPSPF